MIKLPLYNWFVNKVETTPVSNTFKGSVGTDALHGMLSGLTFRYTVKVLNVGKDDVKLEASYYTVSAFSQGNEKSEPVSQEFECSDQGILQAEKWLSQRAKELL